MKLKLPSPVFLSRNIPKSIEIIFNRSKSMKIDKNHRKSQKIILKSMNILANLCKSIEIIIGHRRKSMMNIEQHREPGATGDDRQADLVAHRLQNKTFGESWSAKS